MSLQLVLIVIYICFHNNSTPYTSLMIYRLFQQTTLPPLASLTIKTTTSNHLTPKYHLSIFCHIYPHLSTSSNQARPSTLNRLNLIRRPADRAPEARLQLRPVKKDTRPRRLHRSQRCASLAANHTSSCACR